MKNFTMFLLFALILLAFTACEVSDKSAEIEKSYDQATCADLGLYFWDDECHDTALCDTQNITPCKDKDTGYTWSAHAPKDMDWDSAMTYCDKLTEGGYSDWTLPSKDVLLSLYDQEKQYISKLGDTGIFWSSTPSSDSYAFYVNFDKSYSNYYVSDYSRKTNYYSVRCSRW